jgi:hypothetical protein
MLSGMRLWFIDKYSSLLHIIQCLFTGLARSTAVQSGQRFWLIQDVQWLAGHGGSGVSVIIGDLLQGYTAIVGIVGDYCTLNIWIAILYHSIVSLLPA